MLIKLGWQGPVRKGEKEKEERRKRRRREYPAKEKERGKDEVQLFPPHTRAAAAAAAAASAPRVIVHVFVPAQPNIYIYIRVRGKFRAFPPVRRGHEIRFPSEVWASRLLNQCATVFRIRVHASLTRSWNVNELSGKTLLDCNNVVN